MTNSTGFPSFTVRVDGRLHELCFVFSGRIASTTGSVPSTWAAIECGVKGKPTKYNRKRNANMGLLHCLQNSLVRNIMEAAIIAGVLGRISSQIPFGLPKEFK